VKTKYRWHPDGYALGENEKFYGEMEARGWRLVRRGLYWSKFTAVEPTRARYRVEVTEEPASSFLENGGMDEARLAVFADCGWEYVTGSGLLQIFRAPQGSDAPEFYADPGQQAATLKRLERQYWLGWCPTAGVFCVNLLFHASRWGGTSYLRRGWVEQTALFLAVAVLLLWPLYRSLHGAWQLRRTCRRMKRGESLDHNPQQRHLAHKAASGGILALGVLFLLLAAFQQIITASADLPERADGPYLLLSDLGWEGERTSFMGRDSGVTFTRSLAADFWDVYEYMDGVSLFQRVYRMRGPAEARDFARALMDTSTFGKCAEDFVPVEAEGLDGAWTSHGLDIVAVRGDLVSYLTYISDSTDFDPVFSALAARWSEN